ncbi:3-oxoacyl-ACP synthase [Escherichia coli]|uniref:3-oxoacyl-ACP synthase n=1 Tax=Escherichia coli TaxID=562 RepID=A0A376MV93_ECOLX|nr:3-oxoacyl-ACP synthase [Escherichia coli]
MKYALVVGSDVLARTCDPTDRGTIIIFGDGAGAAVLAASEEPGIISTHLHADGSYGELLTLPNADRVNPENSIHLTMAGNEVFKVAVTELAHIVDETLMANNLDRSHWTGWFRIRLTCVLSVQQRKNSACRWTMSW